MNKGKSPVYAVRKSPSMLDYPGHLAAILYTAGCNFRCRYCHNAELVSSLELAFTWEQLDEKCERFATQWVDAAVVTGGEPTLAPNLLDLLQLLKNYGWKVRLDTNGSRPDVLEKVMPLVDYVAMDVKCGLGEYHGLTCFRDPGRIQDSIGLIKARAPDYEFRTTVVDAWHTDEQMRQIAELVRGARRYVLQPFIPREDLPDPSFRGHARTSSLRLKYLREMMNTCANEILVQGA
ncbi:MAG: anaerobic ribonucleoside-triphosphate reductase activating protein [Kiritimatiellae bacterium]|nr:anaerobic ribonucleoside-triphosphate reductase activating protein [Kiritimatiellia bacterium]